MCNGLKCVHEEMSKMVLANGGQAIVFSSQKVFPFQECFFEFGSITKLYTALAICSLISQNRLSFDDKVSGFFPELLEDSIDVTVLDLLHMNPALTDYVNDPQHYYVKESQKYSDARKLYEYLNNILDQNDEERIRELVMSSMLHHLKTAEKQNTMGHSNTNYYLLGQIIQKSSGKDYYDYLVENGILLSPVQPKLTDRTWPMSFSHSACGLRGTFWDIIHLYRQIFCNKWNYRNLLLADNRNAEEPQYLIGVKKRGDWYFHDGKMPAAKTIIGFNVKKDICFCAYTKDMGTYTVDECFRIIYRYERERG